MITQRTRATTHAVPVCPPRRVVVANYSGYIVGDDAIFEALLAKLHRVFGGDVIIDALTAMPDRTRDRYAVDEVEHLYDFGRSPRSRRRVREMIGRADLLVIGGGDIVEGQLAQVALVALARLLQTPVLYAGVGVLLPSGKRRQQMLRWSAGQARYIATRDAESENLLRDLGVRGKTLLTLPDLAVDLEQPLPGAGRRLLAEAGIVGSRPYVALNLRAPDTGQYAMGWPDAQYDMIADVCRDLVDQGGYDIVGIPLISAVARPPLPPGTPADDELMLALEARIGRPGRVHVLRGDYRPGEVAALLSEAELAVGMRLHFLLLAATCGTPVVGLSYARKVSAFMQSVDLRRFCLDISDLDATALETAIADALAQRHEIERGLAMWRGAARGRLSALESALANVASAASSRSRVRQIAGDQIARVLLAAVHMYGRLREGHLMHAEAIPMSTSRSHKDLLEVWRESLVVDGYTDPRESALHELALYFNMTPEQAHERCLHWEQDSVAEWEAQRRDTPEGLLDFYRTQQSWIFDTVWYHAQQYYEVQPPESVMIGERLSNVSPGKHLDFGAGPGSTSLFFHRLGWEVSLADISTTLQAFSKWRLERRGIAATYYDTSTDALPDDTFDLITACDVMVHVPDPRETLRQLYRALKVGGYLVFNVDARPKPSRETQWHLYPYAYPILRPVRAAGFARLPQLEFFHVYQKVANNSPARVRTVSVLDTCRYNLLVSKVGDVVRAVKARRRG